tara:strand:+ start:556 stop:993 length:438 start_codon:yes stop_codon:yes gene_type:complete
MINKFLVKVIDIKGDFDLGILILRALTGLIMFLNHGIGKITSGVARWDRLGHALTDLIGFEFTSVIFGFMASFSESVGALLIVAGLFTRVSSLLLFSTMVVASLKHIMEGDFSELAFIYALVSMVIMITGPGRHSADYHLGKKFD